MTAATITRKVSFAIAGDWLTDTVRAIWAEGDMSKALAILGDIHGLDEPTKMDILLGKKKFIGISGRGKGLKLVEDNTTEINGMPLLTAEQMLRKKEEALKNREKIIRAREDWENENIEKITSQWGLISVPMSLLTKGYRGSGTAYYYLNDEDKKIFEDIFSDVIAEAKSRLDVMMRERRMRDQMFISGLNPSVIDQIHSSGSTVLDAVLNNGIEAFSGSSFRNKNQDNQDDVKPQPDTKLIGLNGWIMPDGIFYSCGFMGHIRLAASLGKTEGRLEDDCIKVQDSKEPKAIIKRIGNDFPGIPEKGVTQAQYNTVLAWCLKHNRPIPNLKVND